MQSEIINRLVSCAKGTLAPPYIIDLSPTDYCNLRCKSCWQRNERFEGRLDSRHYQLSDKRLLELIDEGKDLGAVHWEITGGGEPLMRRATPALLKRIKEHGMNGSMTTNGTLFTEKLISALVGIRWDKVTFSIDGPDAATNDFLRGTGTFRKVERSLKLLDQAKKANKTRFPVVAFNTVLSNVNYGKLSQMIEFAHSVGCEIVSFEPLTVHSEIGNELKLRDDITGVSAHQDEAHRLAARYGIATNVSHLAKQHIENSNRMDEVLACRGRGFLSIPCYEPWYHLVVKVDGNAGPCCICDDPKLNVKNESLRSIWYGSHFSSIRQSIMGGSLPHYCRICNAGQVIQNQGIQKELSLCITR
ncbi:MAG: radical SAM protein [archaeon]